MQTKNVGFIGAAHAVTDYREITENPESAEAGGGVIADLASHVLDLTHFLLGDFRSLLACTSTAYPERG